MFIAHFEQYWKLYISGDTRNAAHIWLHIHGDNRTNMSVVHPSNIRLSGDDNCGEAQYALGDALALRDFL